MPSCNPCGPLPVAVLLHHHPRPTHPAVPQAAQLAMQTGLYGVWRSAKGTDCTRIGPTARCFCNHPFSEHFFVSPKSPYPICKGCSCRGFAFIPSR